MKNHLTIIISLFVYCNSYSQKKGSSFHYLDKTTMRSEVLYTWPDSGAWGKLNGTGNANIKNLYVLQLYKELKNYEVIDSCIA